MKAIFAVVVALLVLVLGWLLVAGLLYGMGYVAMQARPTGGLLVIFHVFLMWVLSPGVGGYLAVFVTSAIFRSVPVSTVYVSFMSVVGVFTVLLFLLGLAGYSWGRSTLVQLALFTLQAIAIFVGARVARSFAESKRAAVAQA
jgi:hypothetical protein